ncbi:MAG: Cof-type HAD-IIB family hydrolase [Sphaerochaetaceae bacterium]|nr:Cof-type HAD-IIB family hydrolase [Sphaerochaetaceae bacterium]
MFNDCKLICSDVDGTLLDSCHRLPTRNRDAIRRVVQQGIPFALTSGRIKGALTCLQREIGIKGPLACLNGAYIVDSEHLVFEQTVQADVAHAILPIVAQEGLQVFLYQGEHWYADAQDDWTAYEQRVSTVPGIIEPFDRLLPRWEDAGAGFHKMLCMSDDHQAVIRCEKLLKELFSDTLTIYLSSPQYIEILAKGIDKGVAISKLASYFGIKTRQVMAVGDYYNDIPMLDMAGMGVVMANAPEQVREHADLVTASNDEGGLGMALEREVLGIGSGICDGYNPVR